MFDKLEDLLVTHDFASLQEDFQIAREQGYGQFIWNSAEYINDTEIAGVVSSGSNDSGETIDSDEENGKEDNKK